MKGKRWLASLLVLLLCVQLLPLEAMAAAPCSIEVDMAGITEDMGTVTVTAPEGLSADGYKVSGLTETTQTVTFQAEPAEGYEFGGWKVYYRASSEAAWTELNSANLATPLFVTVSSATVVNNAELKIGIGMMKYDLKVVPSFTEAVDPDIPNFVVEGQTPTARSVNPSSPSEFTNATITGWSNDTKETLEIVFEKVYGTTTIFLKQGYTAYTADGVTLDITVNGSKINPTTTTTTTSYVLGDITEAIKSEIEFTVKDAAGHEKPGVIRLAAPAATKVKGTVTAANGSIQYSGETYSNGQEITFTAGESVTLEAVAAENYTLSVWSITANGSPVSASTSGNTVTFTVPDTDFSITVNFVQVTDTPTLSYQIMNGPTDMTAPANWNLLGGIPIILYRYDDSVTFDEAISDSTKRTDLGQTPARAAAGTNILVAVQQMPGMGRYLTRSVDFSPEVSYERKEVKSQYSDDITYYYTFEMPSTDLAITLNIAEAALVTVTATANDAQYGSVAIEPEGTGGYYEEGTQIRLSAVPKEGYTFKEWQETGSSYLSEAQKVSSTVQFTLGTASVQLTAVFEPASTSAAHPIQSEVSESGKATILLNGSSMASAQEGTAITASLSGLDEYYLFDHWEITQNSNGTSLILPADRSNASVTFYMPNDSQGVTVKAVLRERTVNFRWRVFIDGKTTTIAESAPLFIQINGDEVSNGSITGNRTVKRGDTISFSIQSIHSDYELNEVWLVDEVSGTGQALERYQGTSGTYTLVAWPSGFLYLNVYLLPKTGGHSVTLTQPSAGGLIQTSATRAEVGQVVTLTATPLEGFQLQQWVVRDESGAAVSVTPSADSANQATFTMPDSNVTVTAEFVSSSTALPTISNVELLHNGSPIGTANLSGTTWTITLPADTDQSILDNITSQYLRITHNGASVAQSGGTDDANTPYKWADGNVMCNMTLNTPYTFTVRSADGATQVYTITIQYTGGSSGPILTAGAVNRTGDATATVTFTTSASGHYYTAVVAAGAAAPAIDTTGAGVGAVQGSNTISLTNLTTGAKDLYIVVKDENGIVSQPLKVEIPAYSAGTYTITISAPAAGGTIVPSKTTANAGETITLSVVPNTGYQMVAGSLTYTQNVAGSSPVAISNFQFTMPAADVTVTCQWETATTVSGGITSFIINGVSGVINQTTGTITVTLPYGTSVNRLVPVIATANVVSLSPSSGTSVNFNRPVTYTARMTDGTIKTYVVTVYVQLGSTADEMWEDLIDFYDQIPWWEYAERQQSRGRYPRYWD